MTTDDVPQGGAGSAAWRILTICTANQCRSPMAQLMLERFLRDTGSPIARTIAVSSAGTRTVDGLAVVPPAAEQLTLRAIDASDFRSRSLTEAMIRSADLILTATRDHRSLVLEQEPLALRKTFTLLEFAALVDEAPSCGVLPDIVRAAAGQRTFVTLDEYDIADPVGGPDEGYPIAASLIERATSAIAQALA